MAEVHTPYGVMTTRLEGIPASPGQSTGPVTGSLTSEPADSDGYVLVVHAVHRPDLNAPRLRAVVSEQGGPLSSAAIIARELGVPAVFGVRDVCARVSSGTILTVDGSAGVVLVHEAHDATEANRTRRAECPAQPPSGLASGG